LFKFLFVKEFLIRLIQEEIRKIFYL